MTKSVNTAAYVALDKFAGAMDGARVALVKALGKAGITTLEAVRPVAMEWVSARTKCRIVSGAGKAKGRMVLDATHPKYEAAKKSLQRVLEAFAPKAKSGKATATANKSDPIKLLVIRYQALTKAEQKRFLASI